jgi:ADP-ribose pyrophosphatase
VKLQNGVDARREVVEHRGATAIVPLFEDGRIILVRQYRYPVTTELLEIPAGTLEADEDPEVCARRELEEETGYKCREIKKLGAIFVAPGYSTEKIHIYLAKGLVKTQANTDEDEIINVEIMPVSTVLQMASSGMIQDAKTIAGLYMIGSNP